VDVDGILGLAPVDGGLWTSENTVALAKEKLNRAAEDYWVKAVVVRVSSPGGSVTASDILYQELKEFRRKTGKKVIVWLMDVGASGGYYIAMGGDKVLAHPTCVTGSLGVIATLVNVEKLAQWAGVETTAVKSGEKKDMGSLFRKPTADEQKIFQAVIDEYYNRFVQVIVENRPNLDEKKIRALADGRIYTAAQAKEAGLVDDTCNLAGAIAAACQAADISDCRVVLYGAPVGYKDNIYATEAAAPKLGESGMRLPSLPLSSGRRPVFMYLWLPGAF
jgi:protease-4